MNNPLTKPITRRSVDVIPQRRVSNFMPDILITTFVGMMRKAVHFVPHQDLNRENLLMPPSYT